MNTIQPTMPRRRAAAFTLIELMVATGILTVLVLMVGGLFSQASSVWDAGYVRAEGGMVARAVVGAIQRDLQTAVDGRAFEGLGFSDPITTSGGTTIEMVVLSQVEASKRSKGDRGVRLVKYSVSSSGVTREESVVVANGVDAATRRAKWRATDSERTSIYSGSSSSGGGSSSFTVKSIGLDYGGGERSSERRAFETDTSAKEFANNVGWGESGKQAASCPTWCRIRVEVVSSGSTTGVEVVSSGGGKGKIVSR